MFYNRSFQTDSQPREYPAELSAPAAIKFLALASANLGSPEKTLRLATLRVLSYFEPLSVSLEDGTQNDPKRQKRSNALSKEREMNQTSKVHCKLRLHITMTIICSDLVGTVYIHLVFIPDCVCFGKTLSSFSDQSCNFES